MAFKNSGNARNQQAEQNDNWKATAFINVYVNVGEGNKRKLIGIPLKESKAFDRSLIERLQQEGGVDALAANISLTFEMAEKETSAKDLGW
jgi:hypothetical protein